MPLGDPYLTLPEVKTYLGITDTVDDDVLLDAIDAASRGIEKFCNRQFNDAGVVSARTYYSNSECRAKIDDFHTAVGLIVETDTGDDGTFDTAWTASDYQLEPLNGVVDGEAGWPFWIIRSVAGRSLPRGRRAGLQVTARWGWAGVPKPVKQACRIVAAELYKLKDAPLGVAGFGEFGVVRVRDNPIAANKLAPYRLDPVLVG